jgi:hypothetical protein
VKQLCTSIDTTLTPPGTQYSATRSKLAPLSKPLQRVSYRS